MSCLSDRFIERAMTPETENNTMVYREFNGMEAVAQFEETEEMVERVEAMERAEKGGEN